MNKYPSGFSVAKSIIYIEGDNKKGNFYLNANVIHDDDTTKGASIKDVPSKFGFLDPFPPCPNYDVIITVKVALLCPKWADPPSLLTLEVLSGPQPSY